MTCYDERASWEDVKSTLAGALSSAGTSNPLLACTDEGYKYRCACYTRGAGCAGVLLRTARPPVKAGGLAFCYTRSVLVRLGDLVFARQEVPRPNSKQASWSGEPA